MRILAVEMPKIFNKKWHVCFYQGYPNGSMGPELAPPESFRTKWGAKKYAREMSLGGSAPVYHVRVQKINAILEA